MRTQLRHARTAALAGATMVITLSLPLTALAPVASADDRSRGERWETVAAGTLREETHFSSITAAGTDRAWAGGTRWIDGLPGGVLLTWRHGTWREDTTPGLPDVNTWYTVAAADRDDVWAYGWDWVSDGHEALAHYDGRRWRQVALPETGSHVFGELAAVPGRIWLAGERQLSTRAHGTWQTTELPAGQSVSDVHARATNDAWAVGADYSGAGDPLALRWDGTAWRDVSPSLPGTRLTDVFVESARSVWATATNTGDDWFTTRVLHWDGSTWRDTSGPVTGVHAEAIGADGHGRAWMSGDPEGWEGPPLYWRYDGRSWTRVAGPVVPDGTTQGYEVTGLAPIGRTGRFWAVGDYQTVEGNTAGLREFVQRSRW